MSVEKTQHQNCVSLDGEWDLARKDELTALLDRLKMEQPATIDVRGLTYCDSTVLNALARLVSKFQATPLTLLGPRDHMRRLLKLVQFDKLFHIVDADSVE